MTVVCPKKRRRMTAADVAKVLELKRSGLKMAAVCRRLGRCRAVVGYWWKKLGEPRQPCPIEACAARVLRMHRKGHSAAAIARSVGASLSGVSLFLRRRGLAANGNAGAPQRAAMSRALRERARRVGHNGGDYHRKRERAAAAGWPEADSPAQARLLALLLTAPWRSALEMGGALNYKAAKNGQFRGLRWHLARLAARGLVVCRPRVGAGRTRPPLEYDLAPRVRASKDLR